MVEEVVELQDVFIAGAFPPLTYNPRKATSLEKDLTSYLRQKGKCLVVSGPSKAGKTVLVERLLPRDFAVWISGNEIDTIESFWHAIVDQLDAFTSVSTTFVDEAGGSAEASVQAGIPGFIKARLGVRPKFERSEGVTGSHQRLASSTVREYLKHTRVPIVLDDFHYLPNGVRPDVIMAIKQLILITHVILIAVPHEAFEPVRQAPDMNWRVTSLKVKSWEVEELRQIAREGFGKLRVSDQDGLVATRLATVSMGAPALMQQLCYDLLDNGGIYESSVDWEEVPNVGDWNEFFSSVADRHEPGFFSSMSQGPEERGRPRDTQTSLDGQLTDVYGTLVFAIGQMKSRRQFTHNELSAEISRAFPPGPSKGQVKSALKQMSKKAAAERGNTDPALAFSDSTLTILDPFLAFYLQYGSWSLPKPKPRSPNKL